MITTICVLFVFLFDFYNCSRYFITLICLLFYSYNYLKMYWKSLWKIKLMYLFSLNLFPLYSKRKKTVNFVYTISFFGWGLKTKSRPNLAFKLYCPRQSIEMIWASTVVVPCSERKDKEKNVLEEEWLRETVDFGLSVRLGCFTWSIPLNT